MNYVGTELELFQHATNWKRYWTRHARPFVRGRVLDVGCGLGSNAGRLRTDQVTHYTFLEPDAGLLAQARLQTPDTDNAAFIHGDIGSVGGPFETILYTDVLEHIRDDRAELEHASTKLIAGGHLIVLAPAFPFLYSPFDRAIGHHRRYTRRMLEAIAPAGMRNVRFCYLDCAGCLLSLGNRLLTRSAAPTAGQIAFWDRCIVPLSTFADPLVGRSFGRSILMVWQKPDDHAT